MGDHEGDSCEITPAIKLRVVMVLAPCGVDSQMDELKSAVAQQTDRSGVVRAMLPLS